MRVEHWNPNRADAEFDEVTLKRLTRAAHIVRRAVSERCPVGTVSHPMYVTGKYAGSPWTARDAGQLKRSVRVVHKRTPVRKVISKKKNVRVYVGNWYAYYAAIVEYYTPFMRPAFEASVGDVTNVIGAK